MFVFVKESSKTRRNSTNMATIDDMKETVVIEHLLKYLGMNIFQRLV